MNGIGTSVEWWLAVVIVALLLSWLRPRVERTPTYVRFTLGRLMVQVITRRSAS